jgi:hypothetical protein
MRRRNLRGPLADMRDYALAVQRLTAGRSLPDLQRDEALRLAVERAIDG